MSIEHPDTPKNFVVPFSLEVAQDVMQRDALARELGLRARIHAAREGKEVPSKPNIADVLMADRVIRHHSEQSQD